MRWSTWPTTSGPPAPSSSAVRGGVVTHRVWPDGVNCALRASVGGKKPPQAHSRAVRARSIAARRVPAAPEAERQTGGPRPRRESPTSRAPRATLGDACRGHIADGRFGAGHRRTRHRSSAPPPHVKVGDQRAILGVDRDLRPRRRQSGPDEHQPQIGFLRRLGAAIDEFQDRFQAAQPRVPGWCAATVSTSPTLSLVALARASSRATAAGKVSRRPRSKAVRAGDVTRRPSIICTSSACRSHRRVTTPRGGLGLK